MKLADFGCSSMNFETLMATEDGHDTVAGTTVYMSPEVMTANGTNGGGSYNSSPTKMNSIASSSAQKQRPKTQNSPSSSSSFSSNVVPTTVPSLSSMSSNSISMKNNLNSPSNNNYTSTTTTTTNSNSNNINSVTATHTNNNNSPTIINEPAVVFSEGVFATQLLKPTLSARSMHNNNTSSSNSDIHNNNPNISLSLSPCRRDNNNISNNNISLALSPHRNNNNNNNNNTSPNSNIIDSTADAKITSNNSRYNIYNDDTNNNTSNSNREVNIMRASAKDLQEVSEHLKEHLILTPPPRVPPIPLSHEHTPNNNATTHNNNDSMRIPPLVTKKKTTVKKPLITSPWSQSTNTFSGYGRKADVWSLGRSVGRFNYICVSVVCYVYMYGV